MATHAKIRQEATASQLARAAAGNVQLGSAGIYTSALQAGAAALAAVKEVMS